MKDRLAWCCAFALVATAGCSLSRSVSAPGADSGTGGRFDGGVVDVGPPRDAMLDSPAACTATSCDDDEPCTADTCDRSAGCVFTPAAGDCDDGVLCNGADTCSGGTCNVHDGADPCPGASRCDAIMDACTGCVTASDCPADSTGAFGPCTDGDPCATTGRRTRTITSYTCSASGTCEPVDRDETEPCMRATNGLGCGSPITSAWSACTYAMPCDEAGRRTRTVTTPTCGGGVCGGEGIVEIDTDGCARTTTGMSCGAVITEPPGTCEGFAGECGQAGTESHAMQTPTCGGGVCGIVTTSETAPCTRNSDALPCGTPSCTPYGICFTVTPCVGPGQQFRSCTTQSCAGGACGPPGPASSQMLGCTPTSGSACFGSFSCTPCRTVGVTCPSGTVGAQNCMYTVGACGGAPLTCGSAGGPMTVTTACRCPG